MINYERIKFIMILKQKNLILISLLTDFLIFQRK